MRAFAAISGCQYGLSMKVNLIDNCEYGGPGGHSEASATPTMSEQATAGVVGLVADAVWAPSVHNTQPWWFSMTPDGLCLYADPARQLATADPDGREMLISCGAALFTARLALRAAGWIPETLVLPDPARPLLVGQLSWHRRSAPLGYECQLYDQVRLRRSHRGGFDPAPPPRSCSRC